MESYTSITVITLDSSGILEGTELVLGEYTTIKGINGPIVKRNFTDGDEEIEWSLRRVCTYWTPNYNIYTYGRNGNPLIVLIPSYQEEPLDDQILLDHFVSIRDKQSDPTLMQRCVDYYQNKIEERERRIKERLCCLLIYCYRDSILNVLPHKVLVQIIDYI